MTPKLTTKPALRLGPTPMLIPELQTYMLGDFLRAFGIDENTIQICQRGHANGDIMSIGVMGLDANGDVAEESFLNFKQVELDAKLTVDTSSSVSITGQLSRRLAAAISYSATTMRRKGLSVRYCLFFTSKGMRNYNETMQRYGLTRGAGPTYAPGTAMRTVYSITHQPTGAQLTHASAWRVR